MKKLIGLTGKTGAGKSTVSSFLAEKGAYVIDGDIVSRQVIAEDKTLLLKLRECFGDVLLSDGSLDRKKLARIAFSTPENTEKLNFVMHPAINRFIKSQAEKGFCEHEVVVVDAAAIIESGFADECDLMIVVHAPEEIRLSRIMARDNISETDALVRIKGQKTDDFYLSRADYVVHNYEPNSLKDELSVVERLVFG